MNENKSLIGSVIVLLGLILIAGCLIFTAHPATAPVAGGPISISVDGKPVSVNVDGKPIVVSSGDGTSPSDQMTFGANAGEVTNWTSGAFSDDLYVGDTLTVAGRTALTNINVTSVTIGASGWPIDYMGHATATVDVSVIPPMSATSQTFNLSGISAGDSAVVSRLGDWTGASSSVVVYGSVTGTNQYIINWRNTSTGTVDLTSAAYDIWVTSGN